MPTSEAEMLPPLAVMEPMLLLAMTTVPLLEVPMPKAVPVKLAQVKEMEFVPVPPPMRLPVAVPMFADPESR